MTAADLMSFIQSIYALNVSDQADVERSNDQEDFQVWPLDGSIELTNDEFLQQQQPRQLKLLM